jgi:1-deoxy-D-xylulose-5-phosphate reductoisomerase
MRVPIAWGLQYPARPALQAKRLDLADMPALSFESIDLETFRCLALARDAARAWGGAPCVLNAANEIAVDAFMSGQIGFLQIADIVEHALTQVDAPTVPDSIDAARELDRTARAAAATALA